MGDVAIAGELALDIRAIGNGNKRAVQRPGNPRGLPHFEFGACGDIPLDRAAQDDDIGGDIALPYAIWSKHQYAVHIAVAHDFAMNDVVVDAVEPALKNDFLSQRFGYFLNVI